MRTKLIFNFLSCIAFCFSVGFAQQKIDFNHFSPIQSEGKIPADFYLTTAQKIEVQKDIIRPGLSRRKNKKFVKNVYYAVDQILKSGRVTYGDPISQYIKKVGDRLTSGDTAFKDIRYYLIQSNIANAFATHQGIIFITEGMLARLKNEAQLAAILSHELSHYKEKHILQAFIDNTGIKKQAQNNEERIKGINKFSKDKELIADRLGLKMYYDAGYPKSEVLPTFRVLGYAQYPFENSKFPIDYWNDEQCYIPKDFFVDSCPPLAFDNPSEISEALKAHPSFMIRMLQIKNNLSTFQHWEENKTTGSEEFVQIRNMARFETIKNDLFAHHYKTALYKIFLLESTFPNTLYLDKCKAHAWLGLLSDRLVKNSITNTKDKKIEGESFQIFQFIEKLNDVQLASLALRKIYDLKLLHQKNEEIAAVFNQLIGKLALVQAFDWKNFNSAPYPQAERQKLKSKIPPTQFHLYLLSDIKKDTSVVNLYFEFKQKLDVKTPVQSVSKKQLRKKKKTIQHIHLRDFISIEPIAVQLQRGEIDFEASEKIQHNLVDAIEHCATELNLAEHSINSFNLLKIKTEGFNDKSVLLRTVYQLTTHHDSSFFPVDYTALKQIASKYKSKRLVFVFLKNTHKPLNLKAIALGMIIPPVGLTALASGILKLNSASLSMVVLNLDDFTIEAKETIKFGSKPAFQRVKKKLNTLFEALKQKG